MKNISSNNNIISNNKKELRKSILALRRKLTSDYVNEHSSIICNKLIATTEYKQANAICVYMPINNEVDTNLIVNSSWNDGKKVYLPVVLPENTMEFYRYNNKSELVKGTYDILEPAKNEVLIPDGNTLIIMPGAVFSKTNERIGYGGGYYDRYLAKNNICKTVALAYDFQIVESILSNEYDIKPDLVITDI